YFAVRCACIACRDGQFELCCSAGVGRAGENGRGERLIAECLCGGIANQVRPCNGNRQIHATIVLHEPAIKDSATATGIHTSRRTGIAKFGHRGGGNRVKLHATGRVGEKMKSLIQVGGVEAETVSAVGVEENYSVGAKVECSR